MKNVIILGSGRSGTSMVAGAFSNFDFYMGEKPHYLGINKANPKGFFEDIEINTINEDILKKSLLNLPENIRRFLFPQLTFYRARWLARLNLSVPLWSDSYINQRIKAQISKSPFCFKDPRFSYTLPIWQKHLNTETVILVVYREPAKTADSIIRECRENPSLTNLKMNRRLAFDVWKCMYNHILKNYNNSLSKHHWIFVHYEQLFDPKIIREIENTVGAKLNINFPDRTMTRAKDTKEGLPSKIENLYSQLNKLSSFQ